MRLPCKKKMLHHLWLCWSRAGATEVNSLRSCWNLVHKAGGKAKEQTVPPKAISALHRHGQLQPFIRKTQWKITQQDILRSSSCPATVWQREGAMVKVWHTQLTARQHPPASRSTGTTEVCGWGGRGGGGRRFLSLCVLCYHFFTPLCFWSWTEASWTGRDVNTDGHTPHRQWM